MYFFTLAVQVVLLLVFLWGVSTIFVGFITKKRILPPAGHSHTMAVLICAHNEGRVVGKLLESLVQQDYPHSSYHIFLCDDHCTDDTAAIGEAFPNITVWKRDEGPRTGKGAVLSWGLQKIRQEWPESFEYAVIFDADNVADPYFLKAMNRSFDSGARLVMGNRLPLNPYDSLISQWYSMYWLSVDVLFSKPRFNVHMPSIISGTGFGFDLSLIEPDGWQTVTVTEDMEFSMQMNFKDVFSEFQEDARFYDEQPIHFMTLVHQFRRWFTGNYQIARVYGKIWLPHFKVHRDGRLIDNFIPYLMSVVFGLYFILNVFWLCYNALCGLPLFHIKDIVWWIFLYLLSLYVGHAAIAGAGYKSRHFAKGILTGGFFCILISLLSVYSLFRPNAQWIPIEHVHTKGPEG